MEGSEGNTIGSSTFSPISHLRLRCLPAACRCCRPTGRSFMLLPGFESKRGASEFPQNEPARKHESKRTQSTQTGPQTCLQTGNGGYRRYRFSTLLCISTHAPQTNMTVLVPRRGSYLLLWLVVASALPLGLCRLLAKKAGGGRHVHSL